MGGRGTYAAGKNVPFTYETIGTVEGVKVLRGIGVIGRGRLYHLWSPGVYHSWSPYVYHLWSPYVYHAWSPDVYQIVE